MTRLPLILIAFFTFGAGVNCAAACLVTVSPDGSSGVRTIQAAVDRIPAGNATRCVIRIKPGIYNEQVRVPADKPFVSFVGESAESTLITYKLSNKEAGSTSAAFAVYIGGHDFKAENITFENSFGPGSQAVAVLVEADRSVFRNCRFLGWQDTLYAKNGRQYYKDSYIEGHVDYIFGQAAAVFENCVIHNKADGYITAPMRFAADEPAGFVFIRSRLTSEGTEKGVYLGRPWRDHGRTVFVETQMDAAIRPEGWHYWLPERQRTAYMAEFRSTGKGSNPGARTEWSYQLSESEAEKFSVKNFLKGTDGWNPHTATDQWLERTPPDWKLVTWSKVFDQRPPWYQTDEAARIADQVILYQKSNGGWEKNIDMALMLTHHEKARLLDNIQNVSETTIDNRATYTQVAYLGRIITASLLKSTPPNNFPKYRDAFNRGVDYLLASQYTNGGFPQYYPLKSGYPSHITFNDDAMIGVLRVLRDIARKETDYRFVDETRRQKAEVAVAKAVHLILRLQVEAGWRKTIWAAQYDTSTLKPAAARSFEPASLTAGESVGIVRFLMEEQPTPDIRAAVESAVSWFEANRVSGIRWERRNGQNTVVKDVSAAPIWARFYQIETMRPIFAGRDGAVRFSVSEIEAERRNGYAWYVDSPGDLLRRDYLRWKKLSN